MAEDRVPHTISAENPRLPIAPAGCTLDDSGLGEQLDRYRQLARVALRLEEHELGVLISFRPDFDLDLLTETIAIERGCCSFFTLDYDASERRLSIAIDDSVRVDALRALVSALRDRPPSDVPRWST